jgi:Domain of unknown function (DUF4190)
MQPGYPGSGQDPYNQQPPSDPFAPNYGQYPPQPDPYAQPQQPASGAPYQDPYGPPQEYSVQQPTSGQPYDPYQQPQSAPPTSYPPSYQGAPGYQAPGYQPPVVYPGTAPGYSQPAPSGNNTFALISMILGITSLVLQCCYGVGILLGGAAIVLGYLAQQKVKNENAAGKGMAQAGLITGSIGAALSLIWLIVIVANV